jgi:hypothetical protein
MQTVHKYEIKDKETLNRIEMPEGSIILSAQLQNEVPFIWVQVDTEKPLCVRLFEVFYTGEEQSYNMNVSRAFIDTILCHDGRLVLHIYEYTGV